MSTEVEAAQTTTAARAERDSLVARIDWAAWRESWLVVAVSRLAFLAVAYAATWLLSSDTQGRSQIGFLDMWGRWDAVHFTNIADGGYFGNPAFPNEIAFFPLFPLLMRALGAIGINLVFAGMVISLVGSIVAGVYLYKLAENDLGAGAGRRALLYLFLFPTAVFLVAPYSESLFLAGAIAAFYYARRERWQWVGIPAAIAMGARAAGVFLLCGLFVEFLRQKNFSFERVANALLAFSVGLLPLLAYGAYLAQTTGSAFSFMEAQRAGWYREFTNPIESFRATWDTWNQIHPTNWLFAWRLEVLAAMVGIFFLVWALRKKEWGYATYIATTLGALMTSSWYFSIPRILLTLFPMMLLLAGWTINNERRHESTVLVMAAFAALGVIVFTQGIWFF